MTEAIEHELGHEHDHHHDHSITNYLFKTEETCYSLEHMKHFLGNLPDDIFRIKGFVHFAEMPEARYIIQKAGSSFTLNPDERWDRKERISRIVFIGKNIRKTKLQDTLLSEVFFSL
jgi:G3E family GTPase